ncbi:glycine cleavage system H protein [Humidesulfovibrio mexicanus]|uniref:Glycine cleavage system H protein n=1 Tax=Humidesulfovibrio mexicanus TaxID=147047 RepID=A0A238Z1G7_9BACT|nr:glycine cleavage system protein GcvH [Humidesulfovibrio mexicanus]SNR77112.1 glycine cleavage system H protein [Humidesulfovibrio mexicanus]
MIPNDLQYAKSHEWAKVEGDVATVGITHFAQEQLGDLTFVDLPKVGAKISAGAEMGSVESVKAASELYSPVTGEVVEVNAALENAPEAVNQDPYGAGWMLKVKLSSAPADLLDAAAYADVCAAEAH